MKYLPILSAALLSLLPFAALAADVINPITEPDATTASGGTYGTVNVPVAIDAGSGNMALYVQIDNGPWVMVACWARDIAAPKVVAATANWIARQHDHQFRLHAQNDCNSITQPDGDARKVTATDPGSVTVTRPGLLFQLKAADSIQYGYIVRRDPNGVLNYLGSFSGCGQTLHGQPLANTCWSTNQSSGLVFTRRAVEQASQLAQYAMLLKYAGYTVVGFYNNCLDGNNCFIRKHAVLWDGQESNGYFYPFYFPGSYAGDPNAGHWFTGWATNYMDARAGGYWETQWGVNLANDAANTSLAVLDGTSYTYVEQ